MEQNLKKLVATNGNKVGGSLVINGIEHTKSRYAIYETTNYDMFTTKESNRKISNAMTNHIAQSMKENGCTYGCPIFVTKDMVVIDGQHRLKADKQAGLPVYYVICEDDVDIDKLLKDLNINKKNWSITDYYEHYLNRGYQEYVDFKQFWTKYNGMSISSVLTLFSGEISSKKFIQGKLVKDDTYWDLFDEIYTEVIKDYKEGCMNKHFVDAILHTLRKFSSHDEEFWTKDKKKNLKTLIKNAKVIVSLRQYESNVIANNLQNGQTKGTKAITIRS